MSRPTLERLAVIHLEALLNFIPELSRLNVIPLNELNSFIKELSRVFKSSRLEVMTYGLTPVLLTYILKLDDGAINLYTLAYQFLEYAETGKTGTFVISSPMVYRGETKRIPYALLLACIARVMSNYLGKATNISKLEDLLSILNNAQAERLFMLEEVLTKYLAITAMLVELIAVELENQLLKD